MMLKVKTVTIVTIERNNCIGNNSVDTDITTTNNNNSNKSNFNNPPNNKDMFRMKKKIF